MNRNVRLAKTVIITMMLAIPIDIAFSAIAKPDLLGGFVFGIGIGIVSMLIAIILVENVPL